MASGIRFRVVDHWDDKAMYRRFNVYEAKLKAEVRAIVADISSKGEEYMKAFIDSRRNRRTGRMYGDVGHRVLGNAGWAAADVGWIHGNQDYYFYQEAGFRHVRANRWIPGMFAFHDAWAIIEPALISEIRAVVH